MERTIPTSTKPGRRTPTFDAESVPNALLNLHHTSVWAELVVEQGSVEFREHRDQGTEWTDVASPQLPVVIIPDRRHRIVPSADARFHVQFHDWA